MRLDVQGLCWSPDENRKVLNFVELHVAAGVFAGIIGPNGSGKSSLLRCIYRALRPDAGTILLDGEDLLKIKPRNAAEKMAVVLDETATDFDFTVLEMVLMGLGSRRDTTQRFTQDEIRAAQGVLEKVEMLELQNRQFKTLSGGEKQRCLIARGLAQKSGFLVLDEPTNHLDIRHALHILDLIKELRITTLAVLHDLNLAASFCDILHVMYRGSILVSGTPEEVLTPKLLLEIFGVDGIVRNHPSTGKPYIIFSPVKGARPLQRRTRALASRRR